MGILKQLGIATGILWDGVDQSAVFNAFNVPKGMETVDVTTFDPTGIRAFFRDYIAGLRTATVSETGFLPITYAQALALMETLRTGVNFLVGVNAFFPGDLALFGKAFQTQVVTPIEVVGAIGLQRTHQTIAGSPNLCAGVSLLTPFGVGGSLTAAVMAFAVAGGNNGNYSINGSANFKLRDDNTAIRDKVRATGGNFANVVIGGTSGTSSLTGTFTGTAAPVGTDTSIPTDFNWELRQGGSVVAHHYANVSDDSQGWHLDPTPSAPYTSNPVSYTIDTIPQTAHGQTYELRVRANNNDTRSATFTVPATAALTLTFTNDLGNVTEPAVTGTGASISTTTIGGLIDPNYATHSAAFNGTAVRDIPLDETSDKGAIVCIHVLQAGTTATFRLQHAPNNAGVPGAWSTPTGGTFPAITAIGAHTLTIAPGVTLNPFVRIIIPTSGVTGTFVAAAAFCRL